MQAILNLDLTVDPQIHRVAQKVTWILKAHLSVPIVMAIVAFGMAGWLLSGLRLRGIQLWLWLLVPPIFLAASACVAGPGRPFPKDDYEGRVVFQIARKEALTILDVVGLGLATTGTLLALALISWRMRTTRPQPL